MAVGLAGVPQVDDLAFTLRVASRHRSLEMILPSRITNAAPSAIARSRASGRSGASASSTPVTSSTYRYPVAREMPLSLASASTAARSRNHRSPRTAWQKQVSFRLPRGVPRRRRPAASSPAVKVTSSLGTSRVALQVITRSPSGRR
jgi:hypothetical protein